MTTESSKEIKLNRGTMEVSLLQVVVVGDGSEPKQVKTDRKFNPNWMNDFDWLEYDDDDQSGKKNGM